MNKIKEKLTYISLFSGAGIGCHGFKLAGFDCVATAEYIGKRLRIQEFNNVCKYKSGFIVDDLTTETAKKKIFENINLWKEKENIEEIDVIIATPPCQGMSVANHKKRNELPRNSLVTESIRFVKEINPKVFIFENVKTFLSTMCTDLDGKNKKIKEAIDLNLSAKYDVHYQIINFKDYGSNSSRTRTLVVGTRKDINRLIPIFLMPNQKKPKTLKQLIGDLPPLKEMGEIYKKDIYHNFRSYEKRMFNWIKDLKEGESAFTNKCQSKVPHRIINGMVVYNKNKNADKYKRCYWNKPGPCIHTRNDILASQATIHPVDNRVFSIRELMRMMTIANSFKWSDKPEKTLNTLSSEKKRDFLSKEEMNIRQCIGEAVPTEIFYQMALKISKLLVDNKELNIKEINDFIKKEKLEEPRNLTRFLNKNLKKCNYDSLSKLAELANNKRLENAAYYTGQKICQTIIEDLPSFNKYNNLSILEPSVGVGNFLPLLIEKYKSVEKVTIDVIDLDNNSIDFLKILLKALNPPKNVKINFINDDFLVHKFTKKYDLVIGNPPFGKVKNKQNLEIYKKNLYNKDTNNIFSFFIEKALNLSDTIALVTPKSLLSTPEFNRTRELLSKYKFIKIIDYGEKAFNGVKIETIAFIVKKGKPNNSIKVESLITNQITNQFQGEITSKKYPYWLIYRNSFFDRIAKKIQFGAFDVFRDRQITKKITHPSGKIRILKSRNISNNKIINIKNYDSYINSIKNLSVGKYLNKEELVLVPNLSYCPRACFLPKNCLTDGSVAILIPKNKNLKIKKKDLGYFSTEEFSKFYRIARNYGTRSLNIDSNSVFFFGFLK